MLLINKDGNYVFTDPTFKKSFEGKGGCSAHFLYNSIIKLFYERENLVDYFNAFWQKSVYNLIKTTDYKYFHKIEKDFIDSCDDRIRYLIASNKNTSRNSLLILMNDPIDVIRNTSKETLEIHNTINPAKMDEIEFYEWLERATVEELELFSQQTK